jgi:hypothetical protein
MRDQALATLKLQNSQHPVCIPESIPQALYWAALSEGFFCQVIDFAWRSRQKYDNAFMSMIYLSGEGELGALNIKGNIQRAPHRRAEQSKD